MQYSASRDANVSLSPALATPGENVDNAAAHAISNIGYLILMLPSIQYTFDRRGGYLSGSSKINETNDPVAFGQSRLAEKPVI
jgi:hypothetical protein